MSPGSYASRTRSQQQIALLVATRPYEVHDTLLTLVRAGFTTVERGRDDALAFARMVEPSLLVAIVEPEFPQDRDFIQAASDSEPGFLLVVSPRHSGFAAALSAGADACLADDDGQTAFDAQVASVCRRLRAVSRMDNAPEAMHFAFDMGAATVRYRGAMIKFTAMEFQIFVYLARHPCTVVRPAQILGALRRPVADPVEGAHRLKAHICRIRGKLRGAGVTSPVITNVRGLGYVLDMTPAADEVTIDQAGPSGASQLTAMNLIA